MDQTIRRRTFLAVYLTVMILASFLLLRWTFAPGELVQIDDRDAVMRRKNFVPLTSLVIRDPCWPDMKITDGSVLYALGQQINSIPRAGGEFPGEAPGKLSGEMTFADGSQETFSVGTVLTIGGTVFYSPEAAEELQEIRSAIAAHLYTLQNLGSFFQPDHQVTLSDGDTSLDLSPEAMGLLRRVIEAGELVEDFEGVSVQDGGRPPRYTLQVRSAEGLDEVRLVVYANESIQVCDSYAPGQPMVFCFSGDLVPLCQGLLGTA